MNGSTLNLLGNWEPAPASTGPRAGDIVAMKRQRHWGSRGSDQAGPEKA